MVNYKDLIRTIEIVSSHFKGGLERTCNDIRGEHDVVIFDIPDDITAEELRELAGMGWLLGYGDTYEDDSEKWEKFNDLSDDELMDLFSMYGCVYMFT